MFNFMKCSHLIYGANQEYCISFQKGAEDFIIYRRYCHHNFKVKIDHDNKEGCSIVNLKHLKAFCIADDINLKLYAEEEFKLIGRNNIFNGAKNGTSSLESLQNAGQSDNANGAQQGADEKILNIRASHCGALVAALVGRELTMGLHEVLYLCVYQVRSASGGKELSLDLK